MILVQPTGSTSRAVRATSTATPRLQYPASLGSLDLVELIMAFEEEFDGEISDEEAQKITTVGEAVTYINERMIA